MRSQRASSRPDFDDRTSRLGARNFSNAFQHARPCEEVLSEPTTQLSFYFDVAGIVERNPDRAGDRLAKGGGGPELGEQQVVFDPAAQLLGLAGRADDRIIHDAALIVDVQVYDGIRLGK